MLMIGGALAMAIRAKLLNQFTTTKVLQLEKLAASTRPGQAGQRASVRGMYLRPLHGASYLCVTRSISIFATDVGPRADVKEKSP